MKEHRVPKKIVISALVVLFFAVIAIVAAVLFAGGETPSGNIPAAEEAKGQASAQAQEPLSHEELVARTLEAVREYFPEAAALSVGDPNVEPAGAGGNFGIKDAGGTDLGFVWIDNQGEITSLLTFHDADASFRSNITLEQAEDIARDFMESKGIDTSQLMLTEARTHKPSEFEEEHQLTYSSQVNGIPVEGYGNCSFNICTNDGRIVFFSLPGPFILPDFTPPEALIIEDEAKDLVLECLRKDTGSGGPGESVAFVSDEPAELVYFAWEENGVVPAWRITAGTYRMAGDCGIVNSKGVYQVNAVTGEVMELARYM